MYCLLSGLIRPRKEKNGDHPCPTCQNGPTHILFFKFKQMNKLFKLCFFGVQISNLCLLLPSEFYGKPLRDDQTSTFTLFFNH